MCCMLCPSKHESESVARRLGSSRAAASSLALDENGRAAAALQTQIQQLAIILRAIPAVRLLQAWKLDDHRKHRPPVARHHVERATERQILTAELLHGRRYALAVLRHLLAIRHLPNIEYAVRSHERSPFLCMLVDAPAHRCGKLAAWAALR